MEGWGGGVEEEGSFYYGADVQGFSCKIQMGRSV